MTTYFAAPDGYGEPALWAASPVPFGSPHPVLRRCDLGPMAHHWDELVARVIAGNPCATEQWALDKAERRHEHVWAPGITVTCYCGGSNE